MPGGGDHRIGAEGTGGAQDGADIVRIGQLIEHDDQLEIGDVLEPEAADGINLQRDALMHGLTAQ